MTGGDVVVRSGALEARVFADPFGVEFVDLDGGGVLRTGEGGVAFQTTASGGPRRWRSGPGGTALGPEHDREPAAHGWLPFDSGLGDFDVRAAAEGVIGVRFLVGAEDSDIEAVRVSFDAETDEAWLGFGERSDRVVRDRGVVEHYVGEGPYQEYEYPFLDGIVPPWGIRQRRDATYFPIPWVLSTRGFGVAVDNDETSYARLRPAGAPVWTLEAEAGWLGFHVFAGPTPLDALGRYSEWAGRQPAPAAPWYFGPWYQTGHANHVPIEEERRQLQALRAARAPVSAAETHCRYLPLGAHVGHREEERARVAHFHAAGLAALSYLNPLIGVDYEGAFEAAAAAGGLQRQADGSPYTFQAYVGGQDPPSTLEAQFDFAAPAGDLVASAGDLVVPAGDFAAPAGDLVVPAGDFAAPAGRAAWGAVAGELVAAGYDGWMEDFGEYTPLDAHVGPDASGVGAGEVAGTAGHNRYPTDYHAAAAAVAAELAQTAGRPLVRFVRSGWSGTARHAPIVWGGDPTTGWGWDGLASAVVEGLSAGASGIAMWGSDIGGFLSSVEHLTPELLCRWVGFGSLSPVMRTKSAGLDLGDYRRPQIWDDDIVGTFARWAAWHTQLNPYLQAAHDQYRETGRPLMCALALADPADPAAREMEDQYWFGPDLLVAPVLAAWARSRVVYAPRDSAESAGSRAAAFVDLWRAVRYDPATRAVELAGAGRAPLVAAGSRVELPAPLDEIPVLLRAGAVLPLLPAEVDTLAEWGSNEVVHASERDGVRRLLAFPRGAWSGGLGAGERITSDADEAGWRLAVDSPADRLYELRADLSYLDGGAPAGVELVAGDATWSYDPGSGLLAAEWRSRSLAFRFGGPGRWRPGAGAPRLAGGR